MEAEHPYPVGDVVVERRHEATVAQGEQVLRREEAERGAHARLRHAVGAERLRRVLDDREPESGELGEGRGPSEQVNGDDRPCPRSDPRGDVFGVEVERGRVDVREHG